MSVAISALLLESGKGTIEIDVPIVALDMNDQSPLLTAFPVAQSSNVSKYSPAALTVGRVTILLGPFTELLPFASVASTLNV
ncbi:hypothetical protein D3C73_1435870 [compost metagenome]